MYMLVKNLRHHGSTIRESPEEQEKRQRLQWQLDVRKTSTSISGLVRSFAHHPTDFEPFCADLLQRFGYQATVTPPTRDGGFDLRLVHPEGQSMIAECKCYAPGHNVGRPQLQKLVGANQVEHARGLMFITTSDFSIDAIEFAYKSNIHLIDGTELISMCERAWGNTSLKEVVSQTQSELTNEELVEYYIPSDMQYLYMN